MVYAGHSARAAATGTRFLRAIPEFLRALVTSTDQRLVEICQALVSRGVTAVALSTIQSMLARLGLTLKESSFAPPSRHDFLELPIEALHHPVTIA